MTIGVLDEYRQLHIGSNLIKKYMKLLYALIYVSVFI